MPRSASFWKILAGSLLAATVLYLLGARSVPLWERDEPWYAQCSREMLQTGDWVVPKFLGVLRLEKPPITYWCQLTVMKIEGDTPEAARFPSTVATIIAVFLIAVTVRHYTGDRRALWTTFIFATSGIAIACAKFCITDGLLLMFVVIGQISLALMYSADLRGKSPPWWTVPAFWISLGLAGITKGPQPLGMHFMTLVVLLLLDIAKSGEGFRNRAAWKKHRRWWRHLQPLIGLPILFAVVAPWLIEIRLRSPGFITAVFEKAKMHLSSSMEGHGKPPGYHAMLIFGTFFPWSVFLPMTISTAWRNRRIDVIRFAMAATAGPWLMMEIVYTKLPFYVLPAFPGLAFLTADALIRCFRGQQNDLRRPIFRIAMIVWTIAALGLAAGPWFFLRMTTPDQLPIAGFVAFSIAGILYAALVLIRFVQKRFERMTIVMGVGMAVMIAVLYVAVFPGLKFIHLSKRLADDLIQMGAYGNNVPVAAIGYGEPGLAFYQGGGVLPPADDQYLQITPPADWPRWIVISSDDWKAVPADLKQLLRFRAEEKGLNYAHEGRIEDVLILEKITPGK